MNLLTHIQSLDLSDCGLREFPGHTLADLASLHRLDVSGNPRLTTWPAAILEDASSGGAAQAQGGNMVEAPVLPRVVNESGKVL